MNFNLALRKLSQNDPDMGNLSYTDDALCNLESKDGQTLAYVDTNHPHAATGMGSNAYAYDTNGNMVSRQISTGTYTLSYDAESRLVGISGGGMSAAYTYNGDGKRVKAVITTGGEAKTTAYIGDYFEISVGDPKPVTAPTPVNCSITICLYLPLVIASAPQIPAGHAWTSYYYVNGQRVAMRVKSNPQGVLRDPVGCCATRSWVGFREARAGLRPATTRPGWVLRKT